MMSLFTGVEKGFYARVSRLGTQWLELDLHFLSLGGGEIALGWWFEECLVPYLVNTSKLEAVQSISIVTGYGKTRLRGARQGDDGMRKRVRAMLKFMNIQETPQPNRGRVHIDKQKLIEVVKHNGGRVVFDLEGYMQFKEEETTANKFPDVEQKVRPRYRPHNPEMGGPPFIRVETESTSAEFRRGDAPEAMEQQVASPDVFDDRGGGRFLEENDGGRAGRYDHDADKMIDSLAVVELSTILEIDVAATMMAMIGPEMEEVVEAATATRMVAVQPINMMVVTLAEGAIKMTEEVADTMIGVTAIDAAASTIVEEAATTVKGMMDMAEKTIEGALTKVMTGRMIATTRGIMIGSTTVSNFAAAALGNPQLA
jgi:hypothetical protein